MRSLGKILTVPGWVYIKLERWHHLSLLRARDVLAMLSGVHAQSLEPEKIAALIHFIKISAFTSTAQCRKLRTTCRSPLRLHSSFPTVSWIWQRPWNEPPRGVDLR